MVVRVRIRVSAGGRFIEAPALANSGYESETPQLMVPVRVAEELGLWPPGREFIESNFETAGGPLRVWILERACTVKVIGDAESPEVLADLVVSLLADEILIGDKLISELGIALEDVGRGLWRFRWEDRDKVRRSAPPKYWRT
ncbi:MAG: hypothetical protein P3X22_004940 [Thermoprotei archaeon]|nr:hypothetical protein [Thermoprotei archaeon]